LSETSNQVLVAARTGDHDQLLALIQQGFAVDAACTSDGLTALHAAAQNGHLELVEALVGKGADVDASTNEGDTPLKLAASKGHVEVAQALLGAHASVNSAGAHDLTPLHAAVACGCVPMMELLLDAGANIDAGSNKGHAPLQQASLLGQPEAVAVLLARGAIVDLRTKDGYTALHYACAKESMEVVQQLVQAGAAVNAVGAYETTPLHYASSAGSPEVAQQLVQAGAAVNAGDDKGATTLHVASAGGHLGLVEVLLDSGADPAITDAGGCLPLHLAAEHGHAGVLARLLQAAPALVNAVTGKGCTPLILACPSGSMEMVEQLLAAGADPSVALPQGGTALHGAATFGHHLILQRLLEVLAAGQGGISSSIDAEFYGMTPLHCAVNCGSSSCVEVLLEAGADPDKLFGQGPPGAHKLAGATPLHRAVEQRFAAMVPLLATPANMCRLWRGKTPLHLAVSSADERDSIRELMIEMGLFADINVGSMYTIIRALLDAGSPVGVPDADGDTVLALAAGSQLDPTVKLVPAMVCAECRRYKQLLQVEEGRQQQQLQQQQGSQQQDAVAVRAGIVDGMYALLVAAAAGVDPPASEGGASPSSGPEDPPVSGVAAAADPLAPPKHILACLEVVLGELGEAGAASVFQHLLLRALDGGVGAGSPFYLLVYGLLHSGGWPEVEEQMMRRWGAASRLRKLLGQPPLETQQAPGNVQVSDDSDAAAHDMTGFQAGVVAAAAAAGRQQQLLVLLDHVAGLQMAETLEGEMGQVQEGVHAVEVEEGMWELLESLHRCWGAAQQQVLSQMQQEVADAVLSSVIAWEKASDCGHE
jgi:ankyrin repeat protein